jgi:hypothetical protein
MEANVILEKKLNKVAYVVTAVVIVLVGMM